MLESNLKPLIEAILFASGEPISIDKIGQALGLGKREIFLAMENLIKDLENSESGLCIVRMGDCFQLCTKPELSENVRKVLDLKKHAPLSNAAMEVLAIIAYNQPVTKGFVNEIRGVDSSRIISNLVEKNLIEEQGRLDLPGKPLLYGTTSIFLKCFNISTLDELPPIQNEKNIEENSESKSLQEETMVEQ